MCNLSRSGLFASAVVLLASCEASQTVISTAAGNNATSMPRETTRVSFRGGTSTKLLYVADNTGGVVRVMTYPKGKSIQSLTGFFSPTGECVDDAGDVFITDTKQDGSGYVYEYAHGGSVPISTLDDPFPQPTGCAVDPNTGDLALVSLGGLAIFPHASGAPITFTDSSFQPMRYDGYDGSGDLFIDGTAESGKFVFAELPYGGNALMDISVAGTFRGAGAVQWDGQNITVQTLGGLRGPALIDRLKVYGSTATVVGTTTLVNKRKRYNGGQFWIEGGSVLGPAHDGGAVSIWKYPTGGKPTKTIKSVGPDAWGVTVSAPN